MLDRAPQTPHRPHSASFGFSLIEVVVALAISGIVILAMTQISLTMSKQQSHFVATMQLSILHQSIVKALNSPAGWVQTAEQNQQVTSITNVPTHNMKCQTASAGPAEYCTSDETDTGANMIPSPIFKIYGGATAQPLLDMTAADAGVGSNGQPCTGFVTMPGMRGYSGGATPPPGNDNCPFRFEVTWQAICASSAACNNRPNARIAVTLYYNPGSDVGSVGKKFGFNPDNYSSTFVVDSSGTAGGPPGTLCGSCVSKGPSCSGVAGGVSCNGVALTCGNAFGGIPLGVNNCPTGYISAVLYRFDCGSGDQTIVYSCSR